MEFKYGMEMFVVLWFCALIYLMRIAQTNTKPGTDSDFETRRLAFTSIVLSGLGLIFVFVVGVYFFMPAPDVGKEFPAKDIFESAKTIIPPIITLVLGYYFGQSNIESGKNTEKKEKHNKNQNEAPSEPDAA